MSEEEGDFGALWGCAGVAVVVIAVFVILAWGFGGIVIAISYLVEWLSD